MCMREREIYRCKKNLNISGISQMTNYETIAYYNAMSKKITNWPYKDPMFSYTLAHIFLTWMPFKK